MLQICESTESPVAGFQRCAYQLCPGHAQPRDSTPVTHSRVPPPWSRVAACLHPGHRNLFTLRFGVSFSIQLPQSSAGSAGYFPVCVKRLEPAAKRDYLLAKVFASNDALVTSRHRFHACDLGKSVRRI